MTATLTSTDIVNVIETLRQKESILRRQHMYYSQFSDEISEQQALKMVGGLCTIKRQLDVIEQALDKLA